MIEPKRAITPVRRMTTSATTATAASGSVMSANHLSSRAESADTGT